MGLQEGWKVKLQPHHQAYLPTGTLSTLCSLGPTYGSFCALCFIHPFIPQKSAGSFSMPCTALQSARDIELRYCWPTHPQIGIYIDMWAARRVVWTGVCVGSCAYVTCEEHVGVCVGANRFSSKAICVHLCAYVYVYVYRFCLHSECSPGSVSVSICCVINPPKPSGLR